VDLDQVLDSLQYRGSPNFLSGKRLESDRDFGHVYRKAQQAECNLQGAYVLNASAYDSPQGNVPVVYICEAKSETEARQIHRRVWNQNVVPFLLVVSPAWVRLYPGFKYDRDVSRDPREGALQILTDFNQITSQLGALRADSVNSGRVWQAFGEDTAPEKRVDWQLLDNLRALNEWLRRNGIEDQRLSHAMVGKFVYLHYLRQRDILSNSRLEQWGLDPEHIFTRLTTFTDLVQNVDDWLNGSVFPISANKIKEFGADRLRKMASVFRGEEAMSDQLPLFDIYDFSFIPIETLSVIYEQFLHSTLRPSGKSEGKVKGAYYTPVPLVNYMLDKLDSRKPLQSGMRVLDLSCGSGAFLVQCYRKLIERRLQELGRHLRPAELGRILTNHIFGVDIDEDACQIAELSLALTLLEYVDPPDLTETRFQLPALRERNIFCANAFDDDAPWYGVGRRRPFQWIIGNPPWKDLNPAKLEDDDRSAWQWMLKNHAERPVGGNQLAEAFAWRASEVLDADGCVTLLLPAMTLFKYESTAFRTAFLTRHRLWSVGNFANLAEVLFGGRARLPAAAFFYSPMPESPREDALSGVIETYSPLVANQPAAHAGGHRKKTWNIVVNSSEVQEIAYSKVVGGESAPWKIAMWGSAADAKVLQTVERNFRTVGDLEEAQQLSLSQGPELRESAGEKGSNEYHPELIGKPTVELDALKRRHYLLHFPEDSIRYLAESEVFVNKRAGIKRKLSICEPPHVVVSASRNFAVYTERFLVVPARQIGITSPSGSRGLLKAMALYLNSDFVTYHQFLKSPEAGVERLRYTLAELRDLPVPFDDSASLERWETLYSRIAADSGTDDLDQPSIDELNELTFDTLKLSWRARAAVVDLVRVRLGLNQGKIDQSAVKKPSKDELEFYSRTLGDDLDQFISQSSSARHHVDLLIGADSGLVAVELVHGLEAQSAGNVWTASEPEAHQLVEIRERLIEQRAQWLYFNRNLRVYEGSRTYILKPLQRFHWTRTQAIQDAAEIIADCLEPEPGVPSRTLN
jgi:methylase of polypeptide subunit release factors